MSKPESSYWREYGVAVCATLIFLAGGSAFGWTSPTLPMLTDESNEEPLTADEGSWVVSLFTLSAAISPIPTAIIVDKIGRKNVLLLSGVPFIIGWVIIMLDTTATWLYVSRLISGWSYGVIYSVAPMYLAEISSKEIRGSIGIVITIMAKTGILLTYCIGPYVSILVHASILILIPVTFLLTFMWSPKSPYFLLLRGREEEAETSLQRIRGRQDVKQELNDIFEAVKREQENNVGYKVLFRTQGNRRGLVVMVTLAFCTQFCGSQAVIAYSQQIFKEAKGTLDPEVSTIIFGVMQLLSAVLSSMLVDRFGRRPLLITSTLGVTITNGAIGTYFFLQDYLNWDLSSVGWMPLMLILLYIIMYNSGLSAVTFLLVGEIFPSNVRAIASCAFMSMMSLLIFTVTKLYQVINDSLGTFAPFWVFCLSTAIGLVFMIIFVPETKGKSLAQIQIDMNRKKEINDFDHAEME